MTVGAGSEFGYLPQSGQTVKVACIGSGDIVRAAHLPVLKAMRGVEVVWITDPNENRAKEMARVYDVPYLALPKNLSDLAKADVYLIACPFGVRDPYYSVFRERSASLYVEKPFARSVSRHSELCASFPEFALASGLMMRCWGPNMMVRDIVEQKVFGDVKTIRFGFGKPGLVTQGNYYFESKRGGAGIISEVGIHGIDACLFVTGAKKADILSAHAIYDGDLDLHTEAQFRIRAENGREFGFEFTISSLQSTIEGIEIECDNATLSYVLPGQGYALIGEQVDMDVSVRSKHGGPTYKIKPRYVALRPMTKYQMFHKNWEMFLEGIETKTPNWTAAAQALLTTDVIEMCYRFQRSDAEGETS